MFEVVVTPVGAWGAFRRDQPCASNTETERLAKNRHLEKNWVRGETRGWHTVFVHQPGCLVCGAVRLDAASVGLTNTFPAHVRSLGVGLKALQVDFHIVGLAEVLAGRSRNGCL